MLSLIFYNKKDRILNYICLSMLIVELKYMQLFMSNKTQFGYISIPRIANLYTQFW